jgi:hypothetical protein
MAGRGAPQNPNARDRSGVEKITMVADGKTRGFPLPRGWLIDKRTGEVEAWHPATVRWWNDWRKSPQATRMVTRADWDYLLDTALLHHEMWKTRRFELGGEIRLRVANFGATPADRQRLRADVMVAAPEPREVESPADEDVPVGNVVSMDARRERLA